MLTNKGRDWIVLEGNDRKCLRCGATVPIPFPMKVSAMCKLLESFIEEHKDCPPKENDAR